MNEIKQQPKPKHDLVLRSRKGMSVDGVENVISFDESQIELITSCGDLIIEGSGLHITTLELESGVVELDGLVEGIFYSDPKSKADKPSLLARIFG